MAQWFRHRNRNLLFLLPFKTKLSMMEPYDLLDIAFERSLPSSRKVYLFIIHFPNYLFLIFWLCHAACRILVPQPGNKLPPVES